VAGHRHRDPEIDYVQGGDGSERCRYFTTVSLVQNVTDRVLVESLKATSKSKGVKARTITVRAGEDWLFEVARRAYGDPSAQGTSRPRTTCTSARSSPPARSCGSREPRSAKNWSSTGRRSTRTSPAASPPRRSSAASTARPA
jgi:hypothetical protein